MKVALVHDWLTNQGGAERVLMALHKAYPDAPVYTSVYNPDRMPDFKNVDIRTSFLQKWPLAKSKHQLYPILRTLAFESFDFSEYDVVISSCSAEAKGIITKPPTVHICYLHTPFRYYWSDYGRYLKSPGFGVLDPLVRLAMPSQTGKMRLWDLAASSRVDYFIANSSFVAARIMKYYRREATVIHPPVDAERFARVKEKRGSGLVVVSRLIPYKRVDLAVLACRDLDLELTVVGSGSELAKLKAMAGPRTSFVVGASDKEVARVVARSRAMLFCAEEDFGIVPVEAMASGCPVVAYGGGGAKESVIEGQTGLLFSEQTVEALKNAIKRLDDVEFDEAKLRKHASKFDEARFIERIKLFVDQKVALAKR